MKGLLFLVCFTFLVACVKSESLKENAVHAGDQQLTVDKPKNPEIHFRRGKRELSVAALRTMLENPQRTNHHNVMKGYVTLQELGKLLVKIILRFLSNVLKENFVVQRTRQNKHPTDSQISRDYPDVYP